MGINKNKLDNEISCANVSETPVLSTPFASSVTFTGDTTGDTAGSVSEVDNVEKRSSTRKRKKNFKRSQHHFIPRERRRSLPGLRTKRRQENLQFLLSQIEGADIDVNESENVDLCDLIDMQPSAFTELFQEEEKMTIWNNFVNLSEDEQLDVLNKVPVLSKKPKSSLSESSDSDGFIIHDSDNTPEKAFARISYKLRHFLNRKQIPKGELEKIEIDLMDFFLEWPNSIYVTCFPDGFRRMMLHAVSQYLDLEAKSFGSQENRKTQVEAKNKIFVPPMTTLVNYLETIKSS